MSIAPPETIRRIAYLGTPDLAVPCLHALAEAGYEVPLVVSMPDRRRGRGKNLMPSPVKTAALNLGLSVTADLADLDPLIDGGAIDLAVVVAYGRIIPASLLDRLAFEQDAEGLVGIGRHRDVGDRRIVEAVVDEPRGIRRK